ncbi:SdpA family antimicrobial peptide system protein [Microbacterium keratanolyticum]
MKMKLLPFVTTSVILGGWMLLSISNSLAPHALSPRTESQKAFAEAVAVFGPQRWEFFTASPREPKLLAFDPSSHELVTQLPQTRVENAFGISRTQRAYGPELALVADGVEAWDDCGNGEKLQVCLETASTSPSTKIENPARFTTLCGQYLIAEIEPVPFEFRDFEYGDYVATRVANVSVSCN